MIAGFNKPSVITPTGELVDLVEHYGTLFGCLHNDYENEILENQDEEYSSFGDIFERRKKFLKLGYIQLGHSMGTMYIRGVKKLMRQHLKQIEKWILDAVSITSPESIDFEIVDTGEWISIKVKDKKFDLEDFYNAI